jgi:hypothetical protein
MHIAETESNRKSHDENLDKQSNTDRAARRVAERYALTHDHAHIIVVLAGLGADTGAPR